MVTIISELLGELITDSEYTTGEHWDTLQEPNLIRDNLKKEFWVSREGSCQIFIWIVTWNNFLSIFSISKTEEGESTEWGTSVISVAKVWLFFKVWL